MMIIILMLVTINEKVLNMVISHTSNLGMAFQSEVAFRRQSPGVFTLKIWAPNCQPSLPGLRFLAKRARETRYATDTPKKQWCLSDRRVCKRLQRGGFRQVPNTAHQQTQSRTLPR